MASSYRHVGVLYNAASLPQSPFDQRGHRRDNHGPAFGATQSFANHCHAGDPTRNPDSGATRIWAAPLARFTFGPLSYTSMTCVPPAALSCQPCFVGLELIVNAMAIAEMNHSNPPTHGIRLSSM